LLFQSLNFNILHYTFPQFSEELDCICFSLLIIILFILISLIIEYFSSNLRKFIINDLEMSKERCFAFKELAEKCKSQEWRKSIVQMVVHMRRMTNCSSKGWRVPASCALFTRSCIWISSKNTKMHGRPCISTRSFISLPRILCGWSCIVACPCIYMFRPT